MTPIERIFRRFGRFEIDVFGPDSFRIVLWNWKAHAWATCGQLSGEGSSIEQACERLLDTADREGVVLTHGRCLECAKGVDW